MPYFFYISGRAAAIGELSNNKKSTKSNCVLLWTFVYKKFLRLVIPLIFGTILIVIPTAYIGRMYRP